MKKSPYATDNFEYVASAFVNSLYRWKDKNTGQYVMQDRARQWTFRNLIPCPNATAVATGASGYIGGWDGSTPVGQNDEELFQSNLLYSAQTFEPKLKTIQAMQKELTEVYGRGQYEFIKYEAGPGYSLPSPKKPYSEEEERIGKSTALGLATLDNFLFVLANNGNANYYKFAQGNNWSSHNMSMLEHNTTLALTLRKYCEGDLLEVEPIEVATVDIPEMQTIGLDNKGNRRKGVIKAISDVPMTQLYAFRKDKRYSFIALNRSATETKTITLKVPYAPSSVYTLHSYTADSVRATNRDAKTPEQMAIKLTHEEKKGFKDGFTFELKPACAVVIVNEAR